MAIALSDTEPERDLEPLMHEPLGCLVLAAEQILDLPGRTAAAPALECAPAMSQRDPLRDRLRRRVASLRTRLRRPRSWTEEIAVHAARLGGVVDAPPREPDPSLRDDPLNRLAERHRPSKIGHDYMRHYWRHFRDRRETTRRLVEVGVQTDRSIRLWEEFFPNAEILGIDIDPECKRFQGGRRRIFIGDQLDTEFLHRFVVETGGGFDIVIDDGLHTEEAILTTFSVLFPALQARGVYAIEDIIRRKGVVDFLGSLLHGINHFPDDGRPWPAMNSFGADAPWLTRHMVGLSFYRYLCFVERGFNPEENPHLLEPEEFARATEQKRQEVRDAMQRMVARGDTVTREGLRREAGFAGFHHIDHVLAESKPRKRPLWPLRGRGQ